MSRFLLPLYSLLILLNVVCGQTSLYIPGFDPQPVSAEVAGVDSEGQTTWLLYKGSAMPGFTPTIDFQGTATLVQGSGGASLGYSNPAGEWPIAQVCTFTEQTLAVCTISIQGAAVTQTEVVSRIPIQGGATVSSVPSQSTTASGSSRPTDPSASALTSTSNRPTSTAGTDASTDGESPEPSNDSHGYQNSYQPFTLTLSMLALLIALRC